MARRMWDENELIKIAEQHGGEGQQGPQGRSVSNVQRRVNEEGEYVADWYVKGPTDEHNIYIGSTLLPKGDKGDPGEVQSVNGKTGEVELKAEDILVNNSTSVQANLERIDLEVEGLVDDVADLNTGKLDASKQAVSDVGGLVVPTAAPTDDVLVGISTDREQKNIYIGDNLTLVDGVLNATGGGSDYTFTNGLTETSGTVSMAGVVAYTDGVSNKFPTWVIAKDDGVKNADISKVKHGGIHFYDFYQNGDNINLEYDSGTLVDISTSGFSSYVVYQPNISGNAVVVGRASKNKTKCGYSSIIGFEESVDIAGYNTLAVGKGLTSTKFNASSEAFLGKYNIDNTGTTNIFVVGNGTSDTDRHNAFAVGSDNSITIGDTTLTEAQLQALLALLG